MEPIKRLIAIEGTDGSGKATQTKLLYSKLVAMRIPVKKVSFPDYNSKSSELVKMYLNGEISPNMFDINAYGAGSFYSVDRYVSYLKNWKADYMNGTTILADRYIGSNIVHQMTKLDKSKWNSYIQWLVDFECFKLELPLPTVTIFLNMEIETTEKLMDSRYSDDSTKKDLHEKNLDYLKACHASGMYATEKLGWIEVKCCKDGHPLSVDVIAENVWNCVKGLFKEELNNDISSK